MKRPAVIIFLVTLYLLFFHASPILDVPNWVIITLFILPPTVVIYIIYVTFKYGKSSKYTFEERFYEDQNHERNG